KRSSSFLDQHIESGVLTLTHTVRSEPPVEPPLTRNCFIDNLTFDVLYKTFWLVNVEELAAGNQEMPVIISHVCRKWRQYILDIPTMWSVIQFKSRGREEDWARQITYLKRSRSAPLDITVWGSRRADQDTYLGTSRVMEILRIVKPHIHRWRAIHIHLLPKSFRLFTDPLRKATAPALETLYVDMAPGWTLSSKWRCCMFNGGLPNLRVWKTDISQLPPMSTIPSMDKLRALHIADAMGRSRKSHHFKVDEVLYVLSRCSRLEHLSIMLRSYLDHTPRALPMTTPISLPHLVSCDINGSLGIYVPILRHIKAPSVRIQCPGPILNSIIPVIATSNPFPNLESLTLTDQYWWHSEMALDMFEISILQAALSNLPLLNNLVLLRQSQISSVFGLLKSYCPHLTRLTLDQCRFTPSECCGMVEARATSKIVSPLESLVVTALRDEGSFSEQDQFSLRAILREFIYTPPLA
ncbi:hypothetical protein FRC03_000269, partial [Tulasnella sp. 419]